MIPVRSETAAPRSGFSLAEVAIALGIVAFALTAIVGLLSATLKTTRSAVDDLLVSEMSGDIVANLRRQSFSNIPLNPPIYFDSAGRRLNGLNSGSGIFATMTTNAAIDAGAVYICRILGTNGGNSPSSDPAFEGSNAAPNLWRTTLQFQWPVGAQATPNNKTIHADIAYY